MQSVEGNNMTFGDVSNTILNKALKEAGFSKRIDVVFDVYKQCQPRMQRGCSVRHRPTFLSVKLRLVIE